ncbi:MAG TPA: hypothetical protein VK590_03300, partial [Saprospiraceae bacterium]|nr:hypothetical protein [Saprospiraceae bacterium]
GDIIQAKKTAPYILALEKMTLKEKNDFVKLYIDKDNNPADKVKKILNLYNRLNIEEEVLSRKNKYQALAMSSLEMVSASDNLKQDLVNLSNQLLNRQA